jgi:hypothetical protein
MNCKSLFHTAALSVAAGACAAVLTSLPAHAQQLQVLGASPATESSGGATAASQRLILHGIRVNGTINPSARPILDYAAGVLKQYPDAMVYVSGEGGSATVQKQSQAVAHYLQRRGIAANRLMVSGSAPVSNDESVNGNNGARGTGVIVLSLTSPNCGTCS